MKLETFDTASHKWSELVTAILDALGIPVADTDWAMIHLGHGKPVDVWGATSRGLAIISLENDPEEVVRLISLTPWSDVAPISVTKGEAVRYKDGFATTIHATIQDRDFQAIRERDDERGIVDFIAACLALKSRALLPVE